MIELNFTQDDDVDFIKTSSNLIEGCAIKNDICRLHIVHIDNWFGERWLGFKGKYIGAAGCHSRSLKEALVIPPFHPNRVLSEDEYIITNTAIEKRPVDDNKVLHYYRTSGENLDMTITNDGIYAWYSAKTSKNSQGSVMIYIVDNGKYSAFYTMFEKKECWKLVRSTGISQNECYDLMNLSGKQDGH